MARCGQDKLEITQMRDIILVFTYPCQTEYILGT